MFVRVPKILEQWLTQQFVTHALLHIKKRTLPKRQGSLGNVGIMGFVFTNFQADNYGTSSGDDEGELRVQLNGWRDKSV